MSDELPSSRKYQARTFGMCLVLATVILVGYITFQLIPDLAFMILMIALTVLIPLNLVALLAIGIWLLIRTFVKRKTSSPCLVRVWSVFGTFGILCSIASFFLYWGADSEFLGDGVIWFTFSLLSYLLASLGFVQIVSDLPFTRLPRGWLKLAAWRRLLLAVHAAATAGLLTVYIYYLVILNTTAVAGSNFNN